MMDEYTRLAQRFEAERPHLRAVAYRLLGRLDEVDDAVQESWLRLSNSDPGSIANLGAWLMTVVARVCLDMLRVRHARREESLEASMPQAVMGGEQVIDPVQEMELAASVESPDLARHLIEDGLENCVSAFDGFAREACRVRAAHSQDAGRATNLSFQNLANAAKAVQVLFSVDLQSAVDSTSWNRATRAFFKRHLLAHKSGVIDEKYVLSSGDTTAAVGRRISIQPSEVTEVAETVAALGTALIGLLPKP